MTDIRKEQLVLLRFEKQLVGLAASVAAGAGAAAAIDAKLAAGEGAAAFANVQNALINLAAVTGEAHAALNVRAAEAGARVLSASGGIPKHEPAKVVASILGIG